MLLLFDRCWWSVEIPAQLFPKLACALRHVNKQSFHEKAFDIASKFNATIRIRRNNSFNYSYSAK